MSLTTHVPFEVISSINLIGQIATDPDGIEHVILDVVYVPMSEHLYLEVQQVCDERLVPGSNARTWSLEGWTLRRRTLPESTRT